MGRNRSGENEQTPEQIQVDRIADQRSAIVPRRVISLSNLVLDELDKEQTRRGHRFCRGACPRAARKRGPGGG